MNLAFWLLARTKSLRQRVNDAYAPAFLTPPSHFPRKAGASKTVIPSPPKNMRVSILLALFITLIPLGGTFAQLAGTGDFHIVWEAKNRFRLFRNEADFLQQVAASHGDGVLAAERRLEHDSNGEGWAQDVVANLCLDNSGDLLETCERDGVRENYLTPRDHPVGVTLSGPLPQGANC